MLAPHVGVVPVEVGLLGREQVQVPLAGRAVGVASCASRSRPRTSTPRRSGSRRRRPSGRNQKRSRSGEPGPAASAAWNHACWSETWLGTTSMMVRMPSAQRLLDERLGLGERAEVADRWRGSRRRRSRRRRAATTYHGREPDRVDAEVAQVAAARARTPARSPVPSPLPSAKLRDVDLVDHGGAPPQRVGCGDRSDERCDAPARRQARCGLDGGAVRRSSAGSRHGRLPVSAPDRRPSPARDAM